MTEPRRRLIAGVVLMRGSLKDASLAEFKAAWEGGEAWVAEREQAPDEPVQCPCCTKLVTLCLEHYQLRQPGHPCVDCRVKAARVRLLQVLLSKASLEARRRNYWI